MPKLARALPLSEQVFGITSFEVVNEVTHRLMVAEALGTGVIKRDRVRDLRGKRREIAELTEYWAQISAIFGLNILVLPSDEARLYRAQSVRSRYGLLTNDSLILAAMEENGVDSLATRDSDFDHISNLKIYKPTDI